MRRRHLLVIAVALAGCPMPPSGGAEADADFRDLADREAARSGSRVVAWGTAPLGDDRISRRFAVLDPDPDELEDARGAYLIEDRPGHVWRVTFHVDGRTILWGVAPGDSRDADPAWRALGYRSIEHAQGHHHGGEVIEVALRGAELVVLRYEYTGDAETEVTERQLFAKDGVCVDPCPALRGFVTEDLALAVDEAR
jgi:hypothetical protein